MTNKQITREDGTLFTPEPWTVEAHSWNDTTVNGANDETVCTLHIEEEIQEDELEAAARTQEANAKLIAAAPLLYRTLVRLRDFTAAHISPDDSESQQAEEVAAMVEEALEAANQT